MQGHIDDLIETMRHAKGAGLAANQAFLSLRLCVIEVSQNPRYPYKPDIPLTVLVNPRIEPLGDETFDNFEGCLSVPNLRGLVPRFTRIRLRAQDRHGAMIDKVLQGLSAGTFQHEVDHLDGLLFTDRVVDRKTLCTWEVFERHYKAEFVKRAEALVARYGA
jgi:peptide deformylase